MSDKLVSCSFCNGECPASTIREHLMTCGNKTDQCPNCKKYVRRALFAYHYENECADLDESESAGNAVANRTQTFSTFQPNYPPPSSLRPSAANDKNVKIRTVDLATFSNPQTVPTSQQSNSEGVMTYIVCPYCTQECDPRESDLHQEKCVRNPKNMAKKHQPQNNPTSNQNTVQLNHVDQSDENADLLCECCNKPIKRRDYHYHMQACMTQYYPPTLEQPKPANYRADAPAAAQCRHCYKRYMIAYVEQHEKNCRQNPDNIAFEEQLRAIHYPRPLETHRTTTNRLNQ